MNEFHYHLHLVGHPQSGRTVFILAAYLRARELLRGLGKSSLSLGCTDAATRAYIDRLVLHVRSTGAYPPVVPPPDALHLHLYNLHAPARLFGAREVALCHWHIHRAGLLQLPSSADGTLLLVDAAELMDNLAYRYQLEQLTGVAVAAARQARNEGRAYPVAIIFSKCDLLGQLNPALRRVLDQEIRPLTEALAEYTSAYQVFYAAITVGMVPNTQHYFLLTGDSAAPLLWLMDTIHPLNQPPLNVDLDALLNAR